MLATFPPFPITGLAVNTPQPEHINVKCGPLPATVWESLTLHLTYFLIISC